MVIVLGCGVIDVFFNFILCDMLGCEVVNGFYDYFIFKYGNEDLFWFQQVCNNFVKSMVVYLVILFLLQFKDCYNGNIMIDDVGYIFYIDFGFCFDIVLGGIKFECVFFKLMFEMFVVMGGGVDI